MKLNSNTTFLGIATLLVLAGAYWFFFSGSSAPPLSLSGSQNVAQARFEMLIGELAPISFDLSILSDERFAALLDITVPTTPEPIGRTDPFAPLPGVSAQ